MKQPFKNQTISPWFVFVVAAGGGVAGAGLGALVHVLQLPLYLDSILTIVVTIHLGLLPGIVTALVSNGILTVTGQVLFPFVCCNVMTACITWIFTRRGWLGHPPGYVWLGVTAGVANGFFGSVLAYVMYSGVTTVHGIDRLVMGLVVTGRSLVTAVFWSGMVTNMVDKLISAMIAYLSYEFIARGVRRFTGSYRSGAQN
ncbi:MAG: hypothetical protein ACOCYB_12710 [Alkalispirochaeta sp.]